MAPDFAEALDVKGFVKDANGKPFSGAQITLMTSDRAIIANDITNDKGEFLLSGIRPGYYSILVHAEGFPDHRVAAAIHEGSAPVQIELGLTPVSEEVTVTASHQRVEEAELVPQQINLISSEELQARTKSALIELANEEAGLSIQKTSPVMGGIFVRGLTGNKVNVFVDGVRYSNSAARGGVNTFLNLVDPSNLETVEVLRGPSSSLYGSDAIGGSVQLLSRIPTFSTTGTVYRSGLSIYTNTPDAGYGSTFWSSYSAQNFSVLGSVNGRRVNELRPGEGIDSHNAVTRFFDLHSDLFFDDRLPDTEFTQYGGMLKVAWAVAQNSQLTMSYLRGQQDDGKRYDQLIGGDGNLIADLRNLMLDLFYIKYDRSGFGWFDSLTASYSFNTQREERVNQGGNGNPTAAINHEYERTSVHGLQMQTNKLLGVRQTVSIGGDLYLEGVKAPSFREDPVTGMTTVRRGRIPDGASFHHGGIFGEYMAEVVPEKFRLFTNLRYSLADYRAEAADSPIVNGNPLWPDDSANVSSVTYRAGVLWTAFTGVDLLANFSRGFRAPHITDLGTLGLTGAGFEVAFADVAGLGATVGSTANDGAVSTGIAVEQLKPETSQTYEFGLRFHRDRIDTDFTFFLNDVNDNITKQALILPQGAVGTLLGDEIVIVQTPGGAVFVPASSSPVLVRTNFDDARLFGIEYTLNYIHDNTWSGGATFTYVQAEDRRNGLPPNIEGGTPAPDGYVRVKYSPRQKKFWIEPFVHFALKQDRLSTLDLEDRRTGASRSRSSITNFFYNGATVRGLVGPGPDGIFGNEDDVLLETGETLDQILIRVLGPDFESNSLFHELPAYATINLRFGFTLYQKHRFVVEFQNLTDENYRGISWGVDGPGRGVYLRYNIDF
jgi:outer membrane receptor protein involved in Fe transport